MAAKQIDHLVKMANQIALNTGARTHPDDAVRRTAEHIKKFWTPAMRRQLGAYWKSGGEGLEPVVMDVARNLLAADPVE